MVIYLLAVYLSAYSVLWGWEFLRYLSNSRYFVFREVSSSWLAVSQQVVWSLQTREFSFVFVPSVPSLCDSSSLALAFSNFLASFRFSFDLSDLQRKLSLLVKLGRILSSTFSHVHNAACLRRRGKVAVVWQWSWSRGTLWMVEGGLKIKTRGTEGSLFSDNDLFERRRKKISHLASLQLWWLELQLWSFEEWSPRPW